MNNENNRIDIIAKNLKTTADSRLRFERLSLLEAYELISMIKPRLQQSSTALEAVGVAAEEFIRSGSLAYLGTPEIVGLCRRLCHVLRQSGLDADELLVQMPDNNEVAKIGYLSNRFCEDAFSCFCAVHKDSIPRHYSSFEEMCEDTSAGDCPACILPVENTEDGRLLSFYALIDRFDLKISLLCDVATDENGGCTRYALLRPSLTKPQGNGPIYFELQISNSGAVPPYEIFSAAELSGLNLISVNSLPLGFSDTGRVLHFVFCGSFEDILIFTAYLCFSRIRFTPVGLSLLLPAKHTPPAGDV